MSVAACRSMVGGGCACTRPSRRRHSDASYLCARLSAGGSHPAAACVRICGRNIDDTRVRAGSSRDRLQIYGSIVVALSLSLSLSLSCSDAVVARPWLCARVGPVGDQPQREDRSRAPSLHTACSALRSAAAAPGDGRAEGTVVRDLRARGRQEESATSMGAQTQPVPAVGVKTLCHPLLYASREFPHRSSARVRMRMEAAYLPRCTVLHSLCLFDCTTMRCRFCVSPAVCAVRYPSAVLRRRASVIICLEDSTRAEGRSRGAGMIPPPSSMQRDPWDGPPRTTVPSAPPPSARRSSPKDRRGDAGGTEIGEKGESTSAQGGEGGEPLLAGESPRTHPCARPRPARTLFAHPPRPRRDRSHASVFPPCCAVRCSHRYPLRYEFGDGHRGVVALTPPSPQYNTPQSDPHPAPAVCAQSPTPLAASARGEPSSSPPAARLWERCRINLLRK